MRRNPAGDRGAFKLSSALLGGDFKVTPSMRRKVGDLALWLAEGDESKVPETTKLVLELLNEAKKLPLPELPLKDESKGKGRKGPKRLT